MSPCTLKAPPPYSCTTVRTLKPAGVMSSKVPGWAPPLTNTERLHFYNEVCLESTKTQKLCQYVCLLSPMPKRLSERKEQKEPHRNKSTVFPGHMAQVQTCFISLGVRRSPLEEVCSLMSVQTTNRHPFLKHLIIKLANLLENHIPFSEASKCRGD